MDVYYLPPPHEQARYSCRSIYRTAQYSRSITSVSARSGRTALKACVLAVAAAISASAGAVYVEIITNADYGNSYPPKIELTEETAAGEINIDVETISERDNYTLNVKNGLTVEGDAVMRINAVGEDGTDGGGRYGSDAHEIVWHFHQQGLSLRQISHRTGISTSTCWNWIQKRRSLEEN